MPDIFVPLDTMQNSKYLSDLNRKSVLFEFALTYTDKNRKMLNNKYPNITVFKENFVVDEKLLDELIAAGIKKGVELDSTGYETSRERIRLLLKANIARDLWNIGAFWQVYNEANPFFIKALESLRDDTFEKMKIATR